MENELSRVVDALPGLVWTAFPDGEIDFLNHRWCEYTGLSVDEGSGQGWLTAVHPDDLPELFERWRSVLASGEPREMEARLRRFDGEYRWFLFRTYPLRDASGQVVKWCGMNSEINDRSGFEGIGHTRWRLSSAAREDFRSIVDDLPTFVTLMTPDGELELANRQVLEYFGATLEELRARPSASTVHPDDRPDVLAAWRESHQNGQPYEVTGRQRRADGVYRWFHMRAFPLRDTDGRILLWYLLQTDVDDRKRAEALLASEKRLLELIATGASLSATLTELCMSVETLCATCTCCSILLLNPDTKRLWHAASPNVPKAYTESIDGFAIGPDVSSCGTAAYEVKQVIASDIASDPRWAEFRAVALANGLRACWSTPILSQQNVVLGTFAIFSGKPSSPTREDQEVIAQITHLASIAIERERSQMSLARALDELKTSAGRLRTIIDTIPTIAWCSLPDGSGEFWNQRWHDYTGLSPEAARGWGWQSAIHPEDLEGITETWRQLIAAGQPAEIEGRLRRFDGVYRSFLFRFCPLRDETGNIVNWYGTNTDIEDRKQAEALLAGEKRLLEMVTGGCSLSGILEALCRLFESTASGSYCSVVLVDPGGTHLEHGAAPSFPSSFITSTIGRPVNVDSGPCEMAAYLNEQVISADLTSDTRWAAYAWCPMALAHGVRACWATPISSTAGRVLGAFAIYYDEPRTPTPLHQSLVEQFRHIASIAVERAQNDAALKQSEARKAAILDSALDCVVTIDEEGGITEFKPAAERSFGYRREEVVGQQLADVIIPPAFRQEHRRGFARYLATGEERVLGRRIEMTAVRADGSEFPVELAITRIPLDGPPSFTGYLRDITERKRSEEELRRGEAFLVEAQRLSSTGSFSWRVATDDITWSAQLYRIFGFDEGLPLTLELVGTRVHSEDIPSFHEMIDRARGVGTDFEYEHRLLMPDHSIKYLHMVAHAIRHQDGGVEYIGAVQDVTRPRLAEEALGKARSELAHVARVTTLGVLTASIAHEVNQPLSGIITNASTCLRMLAADPPNVDGARETAKRTIRDGNRASELIMRLRALFTNKESTTEPVDLNDATQEVIALSLSELQRNRVILRPEFADDLPVVTGDRVQLQQVILNLLKNASDAMSAVNDRPRQLQIRTERGTDDQVRLTVRDAGVGLDPQAMDRLFQAFYTTKNDGMGIGLSVSRSIIERHHGRLWAEPNDGPGATFSFSIPPRQGGASDAG